ncbi:hypothetical protein ACFYT7_31520, partial [Streptomyces sp. NPDC004041]|uniref:hypothetical protein n=1 Tax=Streptomyces sp. NPDC004041 TaxID=3364688 RepID=UPI0036C37847
MAYVAGAGERLPMEAEGEKAARSLVGPRYAWRGERGAEEAALSRWGGGGGGGGGGFGGWGGGGGGGIFFGGLWGPVCIFVLFCSAPAPGP